MKALTAYFKKRVAAAQGKVAKTSSMFAMLLISLQISPAAQAAGLDKAEGLLQDLKDDILTIIPVVAIIALVLSGIAYAVKMLEKDTFVRWAVGILIAGSASEITALLFT